MYGDFTHDKEILIQTQSALFGVITVYAYLINPNDN